MIVRVEVEGDVAVVHALTGERMSVPAGPVRKRFGDGHSRERLVDFFHAELVGGVLELGERPSKDELGKALSKAAEVGT